MLTSLIKFPIEAHGGRLCLGAHSDSIERKSLVCVQFQRSESEQASVLIAHILHIGQLKRATVWICGCVPFGTFEAAGHKSGAELLTANRPVPGCTINPAAASGRVMLCIPTAGPGSPHTAANGPHASAAGFVAPPATRVLSP